MSRFLVTGASGYIAMHVVDQLLACGHYVRGTVRSLKDEKKVEPIRKLAKNSKFPLELVEAELLDVDSWKNAVQDIDIILHVASPLPIVNPQDEQEVIKPAVDGTLNVLNAALNTSVKRVVVTGSGLSITGYNYEDKVYSESDWSDPNKMPTAYGKSKVFSEKAAWEFYEERKKNNQPCFELVYIHPTLVLGPSLSSNVGTSVNRFLSVFANKVEKVPNLAFPTCDVRDVALAHIRGAFEPEAVGHRHILVSSTSVIPMKVWADVLSKEFGPKGFKIPTEVGDRQDATWKHK